MPNLTQHYSPFWLYFPAFVVVLAGLVVYFWHATPEEQGALDPQRPSYLRGSASVQEQSERSLAGASEEEEQVVVVPSLSKGTSIV